MTYEELYKAHEDGKTIQLNISNTEEPFWCDFPEGFKPVFRAPLACYRIKSEIKPEDK